MKLSEFLKSHSLSQRGLANKLGVSESHISNILKGARSPSIELIRRIIKVTDGKVNIGDLFNPEAPSRLKNRKNKKHSVNT